MAQAEAEHSKHTEKEGYKQEIIERTQITEAEAQRQINKAQHQAQQEAQAGGEGQQNPNQGTPNNDADSDDVQDVEYEEVDERKA